MKPLTVQIYSTINQALALCFLAVATSACAGPATPFGPINFWSATKDMGTEAEPSPGPEVQILTAPSSMVFHKATDFKVAIHDPEGIGPLADYRVIYNGRDVTDQFQVLRPKSPLAQEVFLSFKKLRLPPRKTHDIVVSYRRHPDDSRVFSTKLSRPKCDIAEQKTVRRTLKFKVPPELMQAIETTALDQNINPSLLTALIAQESGFNNKAISTYRAIGLTQMTHIAEQEIIAEAQKWPRYPGIRSLSFLELKYKVLREDIHEENEWRVDPELSLLGGSLYLHRLQDYWSRQDKRQLLAKSQSSLTEVLLASYNIGPGTVSRAIERSGPNWLNDSEGRSPTKYVNMVTDYCEHFAKTETL